MKIFECYTITGAEFNIIINNQYNWTYTNTILSYYSYIELYYIIKSIYKGTLVYIC